MRIIPEPIECSLAKCNFVFVLVLPGRTRKLSALELYNLSLPRVVATNIPGVIKPLFNSRGKVSKKLDR